MSGLTPEHARFLLQRNPDVDEEVRVELEAVAAKPTYDELATALAEAQQRETMLRATMREVRVRLARAHDHLEKQEPGVAASIIYDAGYVLDLVLSAASVGEPGPNDG